MKLVTVFLSALFSISISLQSADFSVIESQKGFTENKGQWPEAVKFLYKGSGINYQVMEEGILADVYKTRINKQGDKIKTGEAVRIEFNNSSFKNIIPVSRQKGYSNYFYGNNSDKWVTDVKTYKKIVVRELYKGISLEVCTDNGNPRYDFILQPGSDPDDISFKFHGPESINIKSDFVEFSQSKLKITIRGLKAFQDIDGIRHSVECEFFARENGVGFKTGDYDKSKPLVIDPVLVSTFVGDIGADEITDCHLDEEQNFIVTGWTDSEELRTTEGTYQTTNGGQKDVLVAKFKMHGLETGLVFSTYIGGQLDDEGLGVSGDDDGNIYITGSSLSENYPTESAYRPLLIGKKDVIVTKLAPDGKSLVFSTYIGGSEDDIAYDIAVGHSRSVYICGGTKSLDYPIQSPDISEFVGPEDIFVTGLSSSGKSLKFSTWHNGNSPEIERGTAIAVNENLDAVVVGVITRNPRTWTRPNFSPRAFDIYHNGGFDGMIMKYHTNGGERYFSSFYGGDKDDYITCVGITNSGEIFFAGYTNSDRPAFNPDTRDTEFPLSQSPLYDEFQGGDWDGFFARINSDATTLQTSTYIGGSGSDKVLALAINENNRSVALTGFTSSSNFPKLNYSGPNLRGGGASDFFISDIFYDGKSMDFSVIVGGNKVDSANTIGIDQWGSYYLAGLTNSSVLPGYTGEFTNESAGETDGFVFRFSRKELELNSPSPLQEYCIGSTTLIGWSKQNFNSNDEFATYISADNGETWELIADGIVGSSYDWKIDEELEQGEYMVKVLHPSGQYSQTETAFKLTSPAKITSADYQAESPDFCLGTSIRFDVEAIGDDIEYTWLKNDVKISGQNENYLEIESLSVADEGIYSVMVNNHCLPGDKLVVLDLATTPNVVVTKHPENKEAMESTKVVFEVVAEGTELSYQWQLNGQELLGKTNRTLEFPSVAKSNEGEYSCIVTGVCGKDTSDTATLTVTPVSVELTDENSRINLFYLGSNDDVHRFSLNSQMSGHLESVIYDMTGKPVLALFKDEINEGRYDFVINNGSLSNGAYLVKSIINGEIYISKLLILD